jgi:hypothetical protein
LFTGLAAIGRDSASIRVGIDLQFVDGEMVSGNYFDVLGVTPRLGRMLGAADDAPGAEPVVVISEAFWQTHCDADADVLGRTWHRRRFDRDAETTPSPGTSARRCTAS